MSVARVSQIERGDVSTQDVLNRFITALGGTLKLIADFGDEQLKIARPGLPDARPGLILWSQLPEYTWVQCSPRQASEHGKRLVQPRRYGDPCS